jgi:hypothetical protein
MTNIGRPVALRASAGLFVLMVGCGAAVVGAGPSALVPDATATNAMAGEAPESPLAPRGPSCIIGLNCGCIGANCPPYPQHHHPAPANGHPTDAPTEPGPGPIGGG